MIECILLWLCKFPLSNALCFLAVILADDSGSMRQAENGERIKDLEAMLSRIAGRMHPRA